jgi:hypothetical protein
MTHNQSLEQNGHQLVAVGQNLDANVAAQIANNSDSSLTNLKTEILHNALQHLSLKAERMLAWCSSKFLRPK